MNLESFTFELETSHRSTQMGNLEIQVTLKSARALRKMSSSFIKFQFFAVAWIDPNIKYCTKLTPSRNSISIWNTKFLTIVDESKAGNEMEVHVEVYSREPLFLKERLEGEVVVGLREFVDKFVKNFQSGCEGGVEEVGSFQLRRMKSGKGRGFVDVSVQISRESDAQNLTLGIGEGFQLRDKTGSSNWTTLSRQ